MAPLLKLAFATSALAAVGGCISPDVVASHPNPPPPRGYRILCGSTTLPLAMAYTYCTPVIAPAEERVVVRAKG